MAVAALALLLQPRWSFAADPLSALQLIKPSQPATAKEFTVPGLDSRPLRLSDFKGKIRLLNFWATWCPPCKEEMPSMERLYRRYQHRGFTIIGISVDASIPAVAPFVKRLGLTFPIGLDPKLAVANHYTVRGLLSSFLIDRDAKMVALALGARDWDSEAARAVMEALLK
jgi:peroxiredoxin